MCVDRFVEMMEKYEEIYEESFIEELLFIIWNNHGETLQDKIIDRICEILKERGLVSDPELSCWSIVHEIDAEYIGNDERFKIFCEVLENEFDIDIFKTVFNHYQERCEDNECPEEDQEYLEFLTSLNNDVDFAC